MKCLWRASWAVAAVGCAAFAAGGWVPANGESATVAAAALDRSDSGEVLRAIEDPATGNRWVLERNVDHPGGPGRLVLLGRGIARGDGLEGAHRGETRSLRARALRSLPPVIYAGDRITLVAHTAVLDAQLEAVALAAARSGSVLQVRLQIGGRIVEAVALGAGRAEWEPESGTRP